MLSEKLIWILEDDVGCQFVYEQILGIRYRIRVFSSLSEFERAFSDSNVNLPDLLISDLNNATMRNC